MADEVFNRDNDRVRGHKRRCYRSRDHTASSHINVARSLTVERATRTELSPLMEMKRLPCNISAPGRLADIPAGLSLPWRRLSLYSQWQVKSLQMGRSYGCDRSLGSNWFANGGFAMRAATYLYIGDLLERCCAL
jgi:hypothetical protein